MHADDDAYSVDAPLDGDDVKDAEFIEWPAELSRKSSFPGMVYDPRENRLLTTMAPHPHPTDHITCEIESNPERPYATVKRVFEAKFQDRDQNGYHRAEKNHTRLTYDGILLKDVRPYSAEVSFPNNQHPHFFLLSTPFPSLSTYRF